MSEGGPKAKCLNTIIYSGGGVDEIFPAGGIFGALGREGPNTNLSPSRTPHMMDIMSAHGL